MTHTTEEFVRRELRSILRGDTYRNRFVCLPCLLSKDKPPTAPCAGVRWNALECARVRHNLGTNSLQRKFCAGQLFEKNGGLGRD